jgi:hypothetical protein
MPNPASFALRLFYALYFVVLHGGAWVFGVREVALRSRIGDARRHPAYCHLY